MSTDKAMMKTLIQSFSVELLMESYAEFTQDTFKEKVDSAAGARYGSGKSGSSGKLLNIGSKK